MDAVELKKRGLKIFKVAKIDVDGVEINYAEAGEGETLILIHGWTNNWTGMVPVGMFLMSKYRVVLIDLPGFGDSGRLSNYNLENEAKSVNSFIKKLKIEKPIIIGYSMGAFVTAELAKLYPKTAKQIILVAPVFRMSNRQKRRIMGWFYKMTGKTRLGQKLLKKIVDRDKFTHLTSKYVNMYRYDKGFIDSLGFEGKKKVSPQAYVEMGVEISTRSVERMIEDNKIPVGMVFGKYDKVANAQQAKELLEGKGIYQIEEVDNAGHILIVEKPKETAVAIVKLIENCN